MITHGKSPHYPFGTGRAYDFDDAQLRLAANALAAAADAFTEETGRDNIKNAYQYDKPVLAALPPFVPEDADERYAYMWALQRTLEKMMNSKDWHSGHYAAERVVSGKRACTPEFRRAQRLHVHGIYACDEDKY